MAVDLSDPAVLADELAATVAALHDRVDAIEPAAVARRIGANLMHRTRPEPIGPLAQLAAAAALASDSVVRWRPHLRVRVESDDAELRLVLVDRTLRLPLDAAEAVKTLQPGAPLTVDALPGLTAERQLAVAAELLRAGVLVPG
jgi:hypothetical protein